ncbi:TPA: hypothetical protein ACOQEI_000439 [Streptococcus pneumoniae]
MINYLLSTAVQKQDAVIFFKRELISIFSYNDYSEANLEIPKLLLNLSLFMVGWLSVILLESDLADHYHHLIRYQSSSFFDYTRKRLVVISKFFTHFSYNDYSEANLEIPKLLLNLSLFMVGWLSVILLESDLADHYHHLIRYQSSSFFDYTRKRLVVISKFFTQDLLVWFLGLLPLGIHFKTVALFFLLAQLMMLYLLLSYLIALISAGAGFSFFLYFLAFVGQEWMMDHIVTVYLVLLSLLVMLILSRLEEKFKKG